MNKLRDLSGQITKALDGILPKEVRCVVLLVDTLEDDVCTLSDMDDDQVRALLEEGLETLKDPDEEDKIKKTVFN